LPNMISESFSPSPKCSQFFFFCDPPGKFTLPPPPRFSASAPIFFRRGLSPPPCFPDNACPPPKSDKGKSFSPSFPPLLTRGFFFRVFFLFSQLRPVFPPFFRQRFTICFIWDSVSLAFRFPILFSPCSSHPTRLHPPGLLSPNEDFLYPRNGHSILSP